jgi:hypothetical protein
MASRILAFSPAAPNVLADTVMIVKGLREIDNLKGRGNRNQAPRFVPHPIKKKKKKKKGRKEERKEEKRKESGGENTLAYGAIDDY